MLCINCKQTKLPADSHILCFRCCGCSQLSLCARSAKCASEIWEEFSHFRRRGPQVAITVTGNECLTRGPRPAPAMLPDGRQRRGHWRTPVPAEIPNLGTCRVIVPLIGMLTRRLLFPSKVTVPSSQFSW